MSNFVGIERPNGNRIWINVDLVTDFSYDAEKDETEFGIVGEQYYRHLPGDLTEHFIPVWHSERMEGWRP